MSEPIATPPTGDVPPDEGGGMLQFDQAEFATPAAEHPTCSVCQQPIPEEYYEINQRVMCPRCRVGVEAAFRGGSRATRFLKATALGVGAAIVGALLYYAFVRATDINSAIVSIFLGLFVGNAVRKGTGNRGGLIYQWLAVFLTYSSIVGMHLTFFIEAFPKHAGGQPAARVAAEKKGDRGPGGVKSQVPAAGDDAKKADPAGAGEGKAGAAGDRANPPSLSDFVYALAMLAYATVMLIGLFYGLPVLMAMQHPISGLIYAFALWEAWKINKPIQLVFNGPFRLGDAGGGPGEVAHES